MTVAIVYNGAGARIDYVEKDGKKLEFELYFPSDFADWSSAADARAFSFIRPALSWWRTR